MAESQEAQRPEGHSPGKTESGVENETGTEAGNPGADEGRLKSAIYRMKAETKDNRRYIEGLGAEVLSGAGCMSPKDMLFRKPPLPVQLPRVLSCDQPIQKAYSTPDITKDSPPADPEERPLPVEILRVMRRLERLDEKADESGVDESGSEDNYIVWSDEDTSITGSIGTTSSDCKQNEPFDYSRAHDKIYYVALELVNTEEAYVEKLEILQKARSKSENLLGKDIARQMFPCIRSIYTLHKDNLLPQLKQRLLKWNSTPNIGDIMKTFAPYLKIYMEYIKNFHAALQLIDTWNVKSPSFSNMLKSLSENKTRRESSDLKLEIKAIMLEPVQRLPRYQLLLQEYCKQIEDNSKEYQDVQAAVTSIRQAAVHFEELMKRDTQMGELVQLQRLIDCPFNLIVSSRSLVKQGKIGKIHATTGKVVDRYIFLFNDLFLLCSENAWLPFAVYKYKVRHLAEIDGMQVVESTNIDVPYTFHVKTRKKAIELCAQNEMEKADWLKTIWQVIAERMRNKLSKANPKCLRRTMVLCSEGSLGKEPPSWIHNSQVTMCMLCAVDFKGFKRKHHCRCCGMVVCSKCSSHVAQLEYNDFREMRVCDECYLLLEENSNVIEQHSTYQKPKDTCVCKGYIQMSTDDGKRWYRRWLEVHSDNRICYYRAQQDVRPLSEIPLSSCTIDVCVLRDRMAKIIRILTTRKTYLLRAENKDTLSKWKDALRTLSFST